MRWGAGNKSIRRVFYAAAAAKLGADILMVTQHFTLCTVLIAVTSTACLVLLARWLYLRDQRADERQRQRSDELAAHDRALMHAMAALCEAAQVSAPAAGSLRVRRRGPHGRCGNPGRQGAHGQRWHGGGHGVSR